MRLVRASTGQVLKLAASATLGAGGEAKVFAVLDAPELAAKVYHRPTAERADKLAAMLANPPEDPMASQGHVSIAWPSDLLLSAHGPSQVMGFLMSRVRDMHPIIDFYHPKTRRHRHPLFNYLYLVRTARNLAACVNALHARGYVVGDLNESNILVGETALVTLVDTDSFQVPDPRNGQVYRCRVGKPEFTPPELQSVSFAWVDRKPEHDLFGLAVLLFQLLMEGIHPFAGKHLGRGEPLPLEARVAKGWFPYAPVGRAGTVPMPTAPPFELLPPRLRDLFVQCFNLGHTEPERRPAAAVWQAALLEAEASLTACAANPQHRYGNHLRACPWCERRQMLDGIDPFPSLDSLKRRFFASQRLRGRPLARPAPTDYALAIAVARTAIRRQRRNRVLMGLALATAGSLLALYWFWALKLLLE